MSLGVCARTMRQRCNNTRRSISIRDRRRKQKRKGLLSIIRCSPCALYGIHTCLKRHSYKLQHPNTVTKYLYFNIPYILYIVSYLCTYIINKKNASLYDTYICVYIYTYIYICIYIYFCRIT